MQREKIKTYLGLANKAGYLIIGSDKLDKYNKKLYLVLIDSTAGKTSKKLIAKFENNGIFCKEIEDLQSLVDIDNCKIVGVKNHGLSEEIKKYLIEGE